ncbi:MAG: hypothetical protein K2M97_05300 [Muribaculaceae bacterium]|nr:hypothetical protein [Muribaculaceae bacterium]
MKWFRRYISVRFVIGLGLVVALLFFTDSSLMNDVEYRRIERDLQDQIAQYEDTLLYYQELNRKLDTDPAELEKIVREHYHMKRTSEDVYIID